MKTIPVVNLNGNSKESLVEQAMAIHHALEAAKKAIAESDLNHGRNFQTAGTGAYIQARTERAEEFKWLDRKSSEYLYLAIKLDEQGR
jgi:outer membrane biogenesis lipoprotein LolB